MTLRLTLRRPSVRAVTLAVTLAAPLLLAAPAPAAAPLHGDCLVSVAGIDLQTATALELQAAMGTGRLTSRRLVEAYLARIAAFDQAPGVTTNSIRVLAPTALAQADKLDAERRAKGPRGPLHGLPILLKDNVGTTDVPTTAGSIALEGSIPLREAFLTEKLRAAGAVILGKTNLSEFANWVQLGMPNGYSSLGGQVLNAYDGGDPSGSSSGSGVAGSMAFSAMTIGTETSGSILSPSNDNSLVGIKPTIGLVSRAGIIPLAPSYDSAGPMVRSVTDAALLLGAVAGVDARDPVTARSEGKAPAGNDYRPFLQRTALEGVRLGYSQNDVGDPIFDEAMKDLTAQGAELVAIDSLDATKFVGLGEIAAIPNEFKYSLNRYLAEETAPNLRVKTLTEIIAFNRRHPDKVKYGQNLLEASDATPGQEAVAIAQSTPVTLAARAAIDAALLEGNLDSIIALGPFNANIGAAAGYPTVIVPAGYDGDGTVPQGISFLGTAWTEPQLISYAYAYEQASRRRVPPTVANTDLRPTSCAAARGAGAAAAPAAAPRPAPARPRPLPATGAPSALAFTGAAVAAAALLGAGLLTRCRRRLS
ncbi:MAG TPA: amidase family protein [Mycobacteriales bacterium]|nr:amidase family protein [Mycobacteriales bacterium]